MKYMLIMRATEEAVKASKDMDFEEVINAMGAYNESMVKAGVLLAGEGLSDAEEGFVVDFDAEEPIVTDGPYGETHELFNGNCRALLRDQRLCSLVLFELHKHLPSATR